MKSIFKFLTGMYGTFPISLALLLIGGSLNTWSKHGYNGDMGGWAFGIHQTNMTWPVYVGIALLILGALGLLAIFGSMIGKFIKGRE